MSSGRTKKRKQLEYDRIKIQELKLAGFNPSQISKQLCKEYKYVKRIYDQSEESPSCYSAGEV